MNAKTRHAPDVGSRSARAELGERGAAVGRRGLRAQLRGLDYASGRALVAPGPLPPMTAVQRKEDDGKAAGPDLPDALPQSRDEVRESLRSASLAATLKDAQEVAVSGKVTMKMQAGTRLSAYVNEWGLSIRAHPPLVAEVDWVPDATIHELKYDFGKASFEIAASGVGPDGIYTHFASKAVNEHFKPKLPDAMQQPGYNPRKDAAFENTLDALGGLFGIDGSEVAPGEGAGGASDGVTDVEASIGFALKGPLVYPIAGGDAEVRIGSATRLLLSAELEGPASQMKVDHVTLSASGKGIQVQKVKGFAAGLQGLEIRSITLSRGGEVKANYNLVVEDVTEGVIALFRVLGALATRDPGALGDRPPNIKLDGIRERVDATLSEELGPRLQDLIRTYNDAIPGVSLVEAFGL